MTVVTCVFYVCVVVLLLLVLLNSRPTKEEIIIPKVDVTLYDVNEFIRREVLFGFIQWFESRVIVKNMSNPDQNSSLINDLKDPDVIKKKMESMTSNISISMSPTLKTAFYAVYNKAAYDENDRMINSYISRMVLFYIRKVNVDITALFENNQQEMTDKLLKTYVITLENEIYKNNDIDIIKAGENVAGKEEGV